MTSLSRKLNRAAMRKSGSPPQRNPQVVDVQPSFYRVLHPTRGWRWVNNLRVWAKAETDRRLGRVQA